MRKLARTGLFALILGTLPVAAQDVAEEEDGGGFLENLIESRLSGPGFQVDVRGFQGALSSRATIDAIIISDDEGPWLTVHDAVLDWRRSALLRGRLEVEELAAARIELPRLPQGDDSVDLPSAEATPFRLPDLPVAINIGRLDIDSFELGQPVIGEAAVVTLEGSANLADGAGRVDIRAERIDDERGILSLEGEFDNDTRELALDLALEEGPNGIVANLADLPGKPSLSASVEGSGPLDDFRADLSLATDGEPRLDGTVTLTGEDGGTVFAADLQGDVTALFSPQYRPFFGPDVSLEARGTRGADGALSLARLSLEAQSLNLQGRAEIGADGVPDLLDLTGRIAATDGGPVLLPVGEAIRVDGVDLDIQFDASAGDTWTGDIVIEGLDRPGLSLDRVALDGDGIISGSGDTLAVTADLDFDAAGLSLEDAGLEQALGDRIAGGARIDYRAGTPVALDALRLDGAGFTLTGEGSLDPDGENVPLSLTAQLDADRLAVFSALAGRPLNGAATLDLDADATLLGGTFDVALDGRTRDLALNIPQLDPLIGGETRVTLRAERDETGTRIPQLALRNDAVTIYGQAALGSGEGSVALEARIDTLARIDDRLSGPATLTLDAENPGDAWYVTLDATGADARVEGNVTIADLEADAPRADGRLNVQARDLANFGAILDRELGGSVDLRVEGSGRLDGSMADVTLDGTVSDIATGQAELDNLLSGRTALSASVEKNGDAIRLPALRIENPQITATAEARLAPGDSAIDADIALSDLSRVVPAMSGAARVTLDATETGQGWSVDLDGTGAGAEIAADVLLTGLRGETAVPAADGDVSLSVNDLSVFSSIANRPLGGSLRADISGQGALDAGRFDLSANATARNLRAGIAQLDQLLTGAAELAIDASRTGADSPIRVRTFRLDAAGLDATAQGSILGGASDLTFDARLDNLGRFVDGLPGPLTARGRATQGGRGITLDVALDGPAGIDAQVTGSVAEDFGTANLSIDGAAPLRIANPFIQPRSLQGVARFDLGLNGPLALSSLGGTVTVADARFIAPNLALVLEGINATARIRGDSVSIDATARKQEGGTLSASGTIGLGAGFPADLSATLSRVVVEDPRLYRTTADGTVTLTGPLTGGAVIGGTIRLGTTELRVPSTGLGATGPIPDGLVHVNAPPGVTATRRRAGLIEEDSDDARAGGGGGGGFALDLTIIADNRIFVRGRGLDAELGGRLTITGTTSNVIPSGRFELIRGRIDLLGQRITLTEGSITLQGDFVPVLRLVARTSSGDVTVFIVVEGDVSEPDITFRSEPELPEDEVLARLIFGRSIEQISPLQAAQLASAVATLAGKGGGGIVSNLRDQFGLNDLDVTTDDEGNIGVRAGAYLSENLYTDVTIEAGGEAEVNLNLDLTDTITIRGGTSNTGESSVGIFYERDY
ncbi:hypothetical protein E2L08_10225 [Palleronia sediminis]|uniref:Translocation and assembly module TamB C-terminal domain-containing protein n=1 Tax=Palleronia sediminis TaxID=2547833 RepID=A0A4R6A6N9_9RHOB|nr:translocation/assembly module TamB domain-containing protein [Palleronia sediminis]TDL79391.1 hypothetical protein E2L08_10225 [Palleronia sediminis]